MNLTGKTINVLGDSITEGVGASSPERCFVKMIEFYSGAKCRNYGISGSHIAKQLGNDVKDDSFCTRAHSMDPCTDAVVVFGGTNDYGHGDNPIGSIEKCENGTFYGAVNELCKTLKEKFSNVPIVFVTPLHRKDEDNPFGENKVKQGEPLHVYVDAICRVAKKHSLSVLDLFHGDGPLGAENKDYDLYLADGLHPNDCGHEILSKLITEHLLAI